MSEWIGPAIAGIVTLATVIGGWIFTWRKDRRSEPVTKMDAAFVRANRVSEVSSDLVTQLWAEINRLKESNKDNATRIKTLEDDKTRADNRALEQDKRIDKLRSEFDAYKAYVQDEWPTLRMSDYPPPWPRPAQGVPVQP